MRTKNTKRVNLIATKWLMAVPKMAKQAGSLVMELTHLFISNAGACALWHWALVAPSSWLVSWHGVPLVPACWHGVWVGTSMGCSVVPQKCGPYFLEPQLPQPCPAGALWSKCPLAGWVWAHMLGEVQCHWWTWPVECQWSVPLVKVAIAMAPCFMAISLAHSFWRPCGKLVWTWAANIQCFLFCPNLKWVESKNVVG